MKTNRREFLALAPLSVVAACASKGSAVTETQPLFRISLAEWSLHKTLWAGELDHLDFAKKAREDFDIGAVEYVNSFFKERARDLEYLKDMKARCTEHGVESLLIMVDGEGHLGDGDDAARAQAVENHHQWIDAAAVLGCHSIRVNAAGQWRATTSRWRSSPRTALNRLTAYRRCLTASTSSSRITAGLSSNGAWLAAVMKPRRSSSLSARCPTSGTSTSVTASGTTATRECEELMPFAKAVSAKSHEFDEAGDEVRTDYRRMLQIVKDAGYRGWIGIEYEGDQDPEDEGIRRTKALLERVRAELTA